MTIIRVFPALLLSLAATSWGQPGTASQPQTGTPPAATAPAPAAAPQATDATPKWSIGSIDISGLLDGYYSFNNNHPSERF